MIQFFNVDDFCYVFCVYFKSQSWNAVVELVTTIGREMWYLAVHLRQHFYGVVFRHPVVLSQPVSTVVYKHDLVK